MASGRRLPAWRPGELMAVVGLVALIEFLHVVVDGAVTERPAGTSDTIGRLMHGTSHGSGARRGGAPSPGLP
jgi:hypothetical protein